jgi:hypothetical protein
VEKERWTRPVNAGYPINTADDDIFFVWSADGERAYFSSEREDSYGDTDIYLLTRNDANTRAVEITGEINDRVTGEPVSAVIIVRDKLSNNLIGIYDFDKSEKKYRIKIRAGRRYLWTIRSSGHEDLVTDVDLTLSKNPVKEQDFRLK